MAQIPCKVGLLIYDKIMIHAVRSQHGIAMQAGVLFRDLNYTLLQFYIYVLLQIITEVGNILYSLLYIYIPGKI